VLKKATTFTEQGYTSTAALKKKRRQGGGEKASSSEMDIRKAKIYNPTTCLIVTMNEIYDNPGEASCLSCLEVGHPAPCIHCSPLHFAFPYPPPPPTRTRMKSRPL
jgi:hypothetical protein